MVFKLPRLAAAAAVMASAVFMCEASVHAEVLPIEAIERFPAIESVSLSPDGKHIVGLVAAPGQKWPVISVWKTDALEERPIWIPTKEMRFQFVDFLGNDKLIFVARDTYQSGSYKRWQSKLYISDLDGGDIEEPLRRQGTGRGSDRALSFSIFYDDFEDPNRFYIESTTFTNQKIYEINARTGRKRNVAESGEDSSFISGGVDPVTGDLLIKQELESGGGSYVVKTYIRGNARSNWEHHAELDNDIVNRVTMSIEGFDGSPNRVVIVTNRGTEFTEARVYNTDSRSWDPEPLFAVPGFDINSVSFGRDDGEYPQVSGVSIGGPGNEQFSVHEYWGPVLDNLKEQFPGEQVTVSDTYTGDDGTRRAMVTVHSSTRPYEYYLFENGSLRILGQFMPWVDRETMPSAEWVTYEARDGLAIPAILSLPAGYDKDRDGPIPTVIHPHGGPWSRDYMGWDYSGWVPFLTTRGIAVLQPQYRGSDGVGMTLWKAGDGEWGQKMQDDKDDGAYWLIEEGIADPEKVAIFGYSYGGFAAIAASVRPDSPYQCAISGAGVSNLDRLSNLWGNNRIQRAFQGRTVDGMDPIENVRNASIPILLYHGSHDRQADTYHSRQFYDAMRGAGADVEYVEIENMWHQLPWWPEWHRQSLTLIEDYLASDKCNNIITKTPSNS